MFKTLALAAALFATSLSTPAVAAPQSYQFDKAHTHILFFIDHLGFSKMVGQFRGFDGTLDFDPADPAASSVSVSIQVASVATDVEKLDEHLRKPDFFDAEKFPTMTFASTSVAAAGEGKLKVVGNLTLLGVTKPVTLDVTVNKAGPHPFTKAPAAGFSITGSIKRSDFGMNFMQGMLGDEVAIRIETEAQVAK